MKIKFPVRQLLILGLFICLIPACKDKDKEIEIEVEVTLNTIEESPFFTAKYSKDQVCEVTLDETPTVGETSELNVVGQARVMYSNGFEGQLINWGAANDRYFQFSISLGDSYSPMVDDINNDIDKNNSDDIDNYLISITPVLHEKNGDNIANNEDDEEFITLDEGIIVAKDTNGFVLRINSMDDQYYLYFSNKVLNGSTTITIKPTQTDIRNLSELAEGEIETNLERLERILPKAGGVSNVVFKQGANYGTMTDLNGNIYKTVTIGTQTWMAENLRTTKYRNGDSISILYSYYGWAHQDTGACCSYNNTTDKNLIATQGLLYNYYAAADIRNIAVEGWHVPTEAEWKTLITYLGGEELAGAKLKEQGITNWLNQNTDATNESGFSATLSGMRDNGRGWFNKYQSSFWTNSICPDDEYSGCSLGISAVNSYVSKNYDGKSNGLSVRLIKD